MTMMIQIMAVAQSSIMRVHLGRRALEKMNYSKGVGMAKTFELDRTKDDNGWCTLLRQTFSGSFIP